MAISKDPWILSKWNDYEIYARGTRIATVDSKDDALLMVAASQMLNALELGRNEILSLGLTCPPAMLDAIDKARGMHAG